MASDFCMAHQTAFTSGPAGFIGDLRALRLPNQRGASEPGGRGGRIGEIATGLRRGGFRRVPVQRAIAADTIGSRYIRSRRCDAEEPDHWYWLLLRAPHILASLRRVVASVPCGDSLYDL